MLRLAGYTVTEQLYESPHKAQYEKWQKGEYDLEELFDAKFLEQMKKENKKPSFCDCIHHIKCLREMEREAYLKGLAKLKEYPIKYGCE
jgi:hypothetical protein